VGRAYLEDAGIDSASHLRDILARRPFSKAKEQLYTLFARLGDDFNGDLFSDDLHAEARQVLVQHLEIINDFFRATDILSGQHSLWPYDFSIVPIETISSIYESFLKAGNAEQKKLSGAFYTPRFLAEFVIDVALDGSRSLLDLRFLDPACGSGIFLVGLFNRLAEEWKRTNPNASYDQHAVALLRILTKNLYGVDSNPTACRITAFSLYLALLDQLAPPDIRRLQSRGRVLPRLIGTDADAANRPIRCVDFFSIAARDLPKVDHIISNPPWTSVTERDLPVDQWFLDRSLPFPHRQLANGFVLKAPEHLESNGRICFILPHGILFNHSRPAIDFQREWLKRHAFELVVNLTDYQRFLFEESGAPALVVRYAGAPPTSPKDRIEYWCPKTDWVASQAEIIRTHPLDRSRFTIAELLDDLGGHDVPLVWKQRSWATPRDRRLLARLSILPRLRDVVGQHRNSRGQRWLIAEGFQPLGDNDDETKAVRVRLPSRLFIKATSPHLDMFLLRRECETLPAPEVEVRGRSNKNTDVFRAPHVLITQGFSGIAFADFDVSFRHAIRGIHGPAEDRALLIFLTAFLRSPLARYFLFHTSSNWGVSRAKIHVTELLRLPFPLPGNEYIPERSSEIVREVAALVSEITSRADNESRGRPHLAEMSRAVEELILEYFDVSTSERMLLADTERLAIKSVRPTRAKKEIPTLKPCRPVDRRVYVNLLCATLNDWANPRYVVNGDAIADQNLGLGVVVLKKMRRDGIGVSRLKHIDSQNVVLLLQHLWQLTGRTSSTFELVRGLKVFDAANLYIVKPLGQRFWSHTAALNDADEIAGTILMRSAKDAQ